MIEKEAFDSILKGLDSMTDTARSLQDIFMDQGNKNIAMIAAGLMTAERREQDALLVKNEKQQAMDRINQIENAIQGFKRKFNLYC